MHRLFLSFVSLLVIGGVACAQTPATRAQLETQNNAAIIPNTVGAVTPQKLNTLLGNAFSSMATLLDLNAFSISPTAPTPAITDNSTKMATTASVFAAIPAYQANMFGADPTGVSISCAAVNGLIGATVGPIRIEFGAGNYSFNCQIPATNRTIYFTGAGKKATTLTFTNGAANSAGFRIAENSVAFSAGASDLSIVTTVDQPSNDAFDLLYTVGAPGIQQTAFFDNVDINGGNSNAHYWLNGIHCQSCANGVMRDTNIVGKDQSNPPGGLVAPETVAGLWLSGYATAFHVYGGDTTFALECVYTTGDSEGMVATGAQCIGDNYAIVLDDGASGDATGLAYAPGPEVVNMNSATYYGGVLSKGWAQTIINSSTFYKRPESNHAWVGVNLADGTYSGVEVGSYENIVNGGIFVGFNGSTTGGSTALSLGALSAANTFEGNKLDGVVTGASLDGNGQINYVRNNTAVVNPLNGVVSIDHWVANYANTLSIVSGNVPAETRLDIYNWPLQNSATPTIGGINSRVFYTNNIGTPTSVTKIQNGYSGQIITILGNDAGETTLIQGTFLQLRGVANVTLANGNTVTLENEGSNLFREIARNF